MSRLGLRGEQGRAPNQLNAIMQPLHLSAALAGSSEIRACEPIVAAAT